MHRATKVFAWPPLLLQFLSWRCLSISLHITVVEVWKRIASESTSYTLETVVVFFVGWVKIYFFTSHMPVMSDFGTHRRSQRSVSRLYIKQLVHILENGALRVPCAKAILGRCGTPPWLRLARWRSSLLRGIAYDIQQ